MKIQNVISDSLRTKQANAGTYLAGTGIVLFVSVITMTDVQARDMYSVKHVEVVVYEGNPVDYSGQKNVIVLEETSFQNHSSSEIVLQDFTSDESNQSVAVVNKPSPLPVAQKQPQRLSNPQIAKKTSINKPTANKPKAQHAAQIARTRVNTQTRNNPVQPRLLPPTASKIASVSHRKLPLPVKSVLPKVKDKNADLIAFYADVFGKSKNKQSKKPTTSITLAKTQNLKSKKANNKRPKTKRVQLAKLLPQNKAPKLTVSKEPLKKLDGKDAELVAFYMDVFGNQTDISPKKSTLAKKRVVKQRLAKGNNKNKVKPSFKPKKRQLAKAISKGKDPELVAFYKQVFGNENRDSSKQILTVTNSKGKDPELVAFYQREFNKGMNSSKKQKITNKGDSKTKIAAQTNAKKKKIAKKTKPKSKESMSTAAVELQKLIDDLTSKNII